MLEIENHFSGGLLYLARTTAQCNKGACQVSTWYSPVLLTCSQFSFSASDDKTFLSELAETQWLSQISELLETASLIITAMNTDKSSVLISYENGCDRTVQV